MRTAFLVLALSGCVADSDVAEMQRGHASGAAIEPSTTDENLCGLATQLPADDPCSMICDLDALKDLLRAEGDTAGRCYDFSCTYPDASKASFGVCLDNLGPQSYPRTDSIH